MKSSKGLFLSSVAAGIFSWILNAFFEWMVFNGSGKSFVGLLINIPPEEFYDRGITILVFILFGLIVSGIYEKRLAAEEKLISLAAELQRSNRDLEQFAAVASHDLKEPLITIGGFLALIRRRYEGILDADANRHIRYVLESVKHMEGLIGDLLEYSRVSTRDKQLETIDSSAILDIALKNLAGPLQSKGAVATRDPLPIITADSTQVGQLFQNLLGNAIKFCRNETPRIHVSAVRRGREYLFSVRDNGIGIEPEYAKEIFTPFRRLHKGDEFPGTGLGLATCSKIVERHGGRIWVESQPGEGSTFFFTIPVENMNPGILGIKKDITTG